MKEQDPTFSAAVQCTLISLQDALARDDIKHRDEGFELALKLQPPPNPNAVHVVPTRLDSDPSLLRSVEPQVLESGLQLPSDDPPTSPSVYSSESWTETLRVISAARSLPSVSPTDVEELFKLTRQDPEVSNAEENVSSSSIDEASFMRMAAPLGW
ncbi:hypothetical protein DAEQUDRAFT_727388 [Daedalea quercina L-15889]|uniref:Uncharacterized protein n=1 Tax=Daedalea quercina L-15889 TaxID=1314783 RepID=A0A165Q3A3_9APHY|nr:hypothetical protein DAEQUDRAFT_727388 [Daedalea quercina L-15889]